MNDVRQVVGGNVRKHRKRLGLTQEQLAAKADMNSDFLSRIELGKMNVSVDVLKKVAVVLGVVVRDFFEGET